MNNNTIEKFLTVGTLYNVNYVKLFGQYFMCKSQKAFHNEILLLLDLNDQNPYIKIKFYSSKKKEIMCFNETKKFVHEYITNKHIIKIQQ